MRERDVSVTVPNHIVVHYLHWPRERRHTHTHQDNDVIVYGCDQGLEVVLVAPAAHGPRLLQR